MPDMYGTPGVVYGGLYAYPAKTILSPDMIGTLGMPTTYRGPDSIDKLMGWFKGSEFDGIADGTDVATWTDQSDRRSDATAVSSAGNRPLVARNSINTWMTSVNHPGTGSIRGLINQATAFTNSATWTVFAVVMFTQVAAESCFFNLNTGASGILANSDGRFGMTITDGYAELVFGNAAAYPTYGTPTLNTWHRVLVVTDAGGERSMYVDNTLQYWQTTPGTITSVPSGFSLMEGNAGGGTIKPLKGKLAELAFYDAAISAVDRAALDTYAKRRFGL